MGETVKSKPQTSTPASEPEAALNEGLEETFPASDVPATTQPGHGRKHGETPDAIANPSTGG